MLYFLNDYSEGAHEKVLQRLIDTNMEQLPGYGTDHYCEEAKEKIKNACGCEDAEVFLLTGGTQTNQIVIDTMLQPYEGVVAAQTGHVSTHEAGAIEFTGHKVLTLPEKNGKIKRPVIPENCVHNAHMYYIKAKDLDERTRLLAYLKENGVSAVFHYIPLHSAAAGIKYGRFFGEDQYTTKESERLLRLPLYYGMKEEDREKVVRCVEAFYK